MSVVAYQGAPGAFGHAACLRFLPGWTPLALARFEDVVAAVADGAAERGMLPAENSIAGAVPGVADMVAARPVVVRARHDLPIELHLLGAAGASLATIRRVASHPVALAQCAGWLCARGLAPEPATNTALAALALAGAPDPALGVAASENAAEAYGLAIVARDIHDRADNLTTFWEIERA
ncbi:hypothetical protein GCM10023232_10930 [Sphingosinicella ginsenosidimutans]|uniref:prephenate dehydratase domain-containing protein n=1 Tax=Allosphingosinicella ginsenosidimutans TaxID=1176539 RepID=UPI001315703C|nr:prephenate dehydratase domain-containing protein [Sphingosinicella ginsenosidimutans]